MSCKVEGCKYPESHTTIAHRCGKCGKYGHGQIECGSNYLCHQLKKHHGDRINFLNRCSIIGCSHPETHSTSAHHCIKCGRRHGEQDCIIQSIEHYKERFPDDMYLKYFNEMNFVQNHLLSGPTIVPLTLGQGCILYVRIKDMKLSALFMHSDMMGQYGEYEDLIICREFVKDCNILESNTFSSLPQPEQRIIKCPICRKENTEKQISNAYGLEQKCSVCLENNVDKFFQACGHAPVCHVCLKHI